MTNKKPGDKGQVLFRCMKDDGGCLKFFMTLTLKMTLR